MDGSSSRLYGTLFSACRAFFDPSVLGVIGPSSASRQRTRDPAFGAHVSLSARAGPTGVGEVPCLARRHRLIVYGRGASAAKSTCVPMCNVCIISYHPVQWSRRGHLLWHLTGLSYPPLATIGGKALGNSQSITRQYQPRQQAFARLSVSQLRALFTSFVYFGKRCHVPCARAAHTHAIDLLVFTQCAPACNSGPCLQRITHKRELGGCAVRGSFGVDVV